MRPNPTTGVITGAVYGSNQILCGNVFSTQWCVESSRDLTVAIREYGPRPEDGRRSSPSRTGCRPRSGPATEDVPASGPAFAGALGKPSPRPAKESGPADGLLPCPAA